MLGNFSAAGSRGVALPPPRVAYFPRNARLPKASQGCGVQGAGRGSARHRTQPSRNHGPRFFHHPPPPADRSRSPGILPSRSHPHRPPCPLVSFVLPKPRGSIKRENFAARRQRAGECIVRAALCGSGRARDACLRDRRLTARELRSAGLRDPTGAFNAQRLRPGNLFRRQRS